MASETGDAITAQLSLEERIWVSLADKTKRPLKPLGKQALLPQTAAEAAEADSKHIGVQMKLTPGFSGCPAF
jgi:hypothetical protein